MKAWLVSDPDGDAGSEIVYADTRGEARSIGAQTFLDLEWTSLSVKRLPKWDDRENSPPTAKELLADNWLVGCWHCEALCSGEDEPPPEWIDDKLVCAACAANRTAKAAGGAR